MHNQRGEKKKKERNFVLEANAPSSHSLSSLFHYFSHEIHANPNTQQVLLQARYTCVVMQVRSGLNSERYGTLLAEQPWRRELLPLPLLENNPVTLERASSEGIAAVLITWHTHFLMILLILVNFGASESTQWRK